MRIAMVSEHASPLAVLGGVDAGGQNVHVAALATAMARRGHEVIVHTRRDDPALPRRVALAPGAWVDHVDAGPARELPKDELLPYMEAFAADLLERWRDERPEVVHAHFWMSAYAALRAARRLGIPVVQTFHALGVVKRRYQGDHDTSPPGRLEIERDVIRRADRLVCTCTDEAFELVRLGADRTKLAVIPCGVDLERFTPEGPALERTPGVRRIAAIGRLVQRKGVGNVIEALAHVPQTELLIAGGPEAPDLGRDGEALRLTRLAAQHHVDGRVRLLGRVSRNDLPVLLRSLDAVVCAPWYEPFGIVPLEAMACGVPVVASAVGGMIDTIVDGVTGVHVPPRDPERLASVLTDLLDDDARRHEMGSAGVRRARQLYAWDRIAGATLDVYEPLTTRLASRRDAARRSAGRPSGARGHLSDLAAALAAAEAEVLRADAWGEELGGRLLDGARLLTVGNGGSAAEAQHLTAELVGRFEGERVPLSALCLHGDTSSLTAICNDYGADELFARQVRAHGRPGDVLLALSTSGRSPNVLAAVEAARECRMTTWGMTGPSPNPLAAACDDVLCIDAACMATVQELHLVAAHVLCAAVDRAVAAREAGGRAVELRAEVP